MTITQWFANHDSKARRMLKLSGMLVGLLLFLLPTGAKAVPLTYNLSGVTFSDSATASGSFQYDAVTNTYSNISIVTTNGGSRSGATYNFVSGGLVADSSEVLLVTMAGTGQTGLPGLALFFSPLLNGAGGVFTLTGTEASCSDSQCNNPSGGTRTITAGTLSAGVAATWFLDGVTFADGAIATGSFVYDPITNSFSNVNITTTSSTRNGSTYKTVSPGFLPDATGVVFNTSAAPNLTGLPGFGMFFSPELSGVGGTSAVTGQEANCADQICSAPTGTTRFIASGNVTTIPPSLSINDVTVTEVNGATISAAFTVTLSRPLATTTTVDYFTANGTAEAPADYQSVTGTLTFLPGTTTRTITVPVNGDTASESGDESHFSENFFLNLANPNGATISKAQGVGTINRGDVTSTLQFSSPSVSANENASPPSVSLTVTRTGSTSSPASVRFETSDGTASQKNKYTFNSGTLQWGAGDSTSKTITVLLTNEAFVEGNKTFTVTLSNPSPGAAIGSPDTATVTIVDDDTVAPTTNPIDDPTFFVRQHYLDFLGREPDSAGLTFWTGQITSCGANASCIAAARVNVSAAFFFSIEYQETSGDVIRTQRVAFGRQSSDPNSRVLYPQFMRDTRQVGAGVVVGQGQWQQMLEANKQAYAQQLVNDPTFLARFPITPGAQYVDSLFASAGVTPTADERTAAINAFGMGGTPGRIAALRSVSDANSVRQAEFTPSFVLAEYFGYLRRNPTGPPDNNDAGFQFWLAKLNSFNGDFNKADMVKAFIASSEYRQRFGP